MILVPVGREVKHLVIFLLQEVPAEVKCKRSFHYPCRSMKTPFCKFQPDIAQRIYKGVMHHFRGVVLHFANEPSKKQGGKGKDNVSGYQHAVNQEEFTAFVPGILPTGS